MMEWNDVHDMMDEMGLCPECNDVGCGCKDELNDESNEWSKDGKGNRGFLGKNFLLD